MENRHWRKGIPNPQSGRGPQPVSALLIHPFIISQLDYYNVLCDGLPCKTTGKLQLVQKVAAQLMSEASQREHILLSLKELHWLQVLLKGLVMAHKAVHGLGPYDTAASSWLLL